MLNQLLQYNDIGLFLMRIVIAVIFIYHGLPKVSKSKMMAGGMGMPAFVVFILGMVEILSSLGLVFGIFIQLSALLLSVVMLGAIYMKAMKWGVPFSARDKMGWEFDLILLAASVALILGGGGSLGIF